MAISNTKRLRLFGLTVFLLLLTVYTQAQNIFKNEQEAEKAEIQLSHKTPKSSNTVKMLLSLSNWYFDEQEKTPERIQKSYSYALTAFNLSKKLKYNKGIAEGYLQFSKIEQQNKNYKTAKLYAKNAVVSLQQINEPELLGEAWVMFWSTSVLTGTSYKDRIVLLRSAAKAFGRSGNKKREADCLKELGDIYQLLGNGKEALIVLKNALRLYHEAGYSRLHELYDLIGAAYIFMGDYKEGINYGFMAIRTAEKLGDSSIFLCTIYNRIGLAYIEIQDLNNAKKYFQESLKVAIRYNDTESISILVQNYADVLLKLNKYDEALLFINKMRARFPLINRSKSPGIECQLIQIFVAKKQLSKAFPYTQIVKKKIQDIEDYDNLLIGYSTLIQLNINLKNYKEAGYYLGLYDKLTKRLDKTVYYADYNLWKYRIDSAEGNCIPAMEHFQKYIRLSNRDFDEKKTRIINQLSVLYETEKKNRDISNLKTQSVSQRSKLERATLMKNIMLGGLVLLFIILFLMYKGYSLKQKTNKVLKKQQDEINQKNQSLQLVVKEKEWLLKEIHHRVKNNLHMVVGLLASQTEFLKSKEAVAAISESQRRVEAMAMIHQKLYQSDNLSMIDMPSYILELTNYLADSFDKIKRIRFSLDIDKVEFPLSHSIPIGLIINEAVTNAIKYAFPNDKEGTVQVILKDKGNGSFYLSISDNGVGIPADFDFENASSLGINLMQGLSEDIHGNCKIYNDKGTKIELNFTIEDSSFEDSI